ncbi:hypothetical protein VP01_1677g1 [Puccinia sorghi]|uniref:Uncharacterized protein n=1 Tax=Puccinia sorghi TaxID=27349 RepID=A0A0L6VG02_9BASI|nr:hypothetical protein VP01_1677g1 [Puccinia sorghi]
MTLFKNLFVQMEADVRLLRIVEEKCVVFKSQANQLITQGRIFRISFRVATTRKELSVHPQAVFSFHSGNQVFCPWPGQYLQAKLERMNLKLLVKNNTWNIVPQDLYQPLSRLPKGAAKGKMACLATYKIILNDDSNNFVLTDNGKKGNSKVSDSTTEFDPKFSEGQESDMEGSYGDSEGSFLRGLNSNKKKKQLGGFNQKNTSSVSRKFQGVRLNRSSATAPPRK